MNKDLIYIAKITKAHGIRGQAKLMSYSAIAEDVFKYPCLFDKDLNEYQFKMHSQNNNMFIVSFNQNTSRNLIESIAGTELYIKKDMLPALENDEFYNNDLIGVEIRDPENKVHGHILEIHNFGADDIIEMKILDQKDTIFLPFDNNHISEINVKQNYLVFDFINSGVEYKVKKC